MGEVASQVLPHLLPHSRVARLHRGILNFKQEEKESLGVAWAQITDLASSGPDIAITEPTLM